jgi:hypothetical protein
MYYILRSSDSQRASHEDLIATLWVGAVAHGSVTRYLREISGFAPTDAAPSVDIPVLIDDANPAVLELLGEISFGSIRHLSQLTHLSSATVY